MKRIIPVSIIIFLFQISFAQQADINFDNYFISKSMRFDYYHAGNSDTETIYPEQLKQEPHWGGSKTNLIDTFNYGKYRVMVYDSLSNNLIYSRGYCTLFQEWQATPEAKNIDKSFYEAVTFPYPKQTIKFKIQSRNKKNVFTTINSQYISPNNYFIKKETPVNYKNYKLVDSGDPSKKVDMVIISDGYTQQEMAKFKSDAQRFTNKLLKSAPFNEHQDKFNIWVIEAISLESGTDIPGKGIWKNTILNSSFYTFNSERYLTTQDIKSLRDIVALVPYDQIYILVNTEKYGGGGIYNFYNLCSSDDDLSEMVFLHEFGHGFGGLADEYYTSDVSVECYYSKEVEPWEPNITNLVDFDNKWKHLIKKKNPIPTPQTKKYHDEIGVFEGAGYVEKGLYRPYYSCMMKSLQGNNGFCPVCKKTIIDMINFYSE